MRPSLPFQMRSQQTPEQGKYISDIHRKLASIRDRMKAKLSDDCYQFLGGSTATVFDEQMRDAIIAFQRTFKLKQEGSAGEGICDETTWGRLNEEAGSVYCEVWQYELDAFRERRNLAAGLAAARDNPHEQKDARAARQDSQLETDHDPENATQRGPDRIETITSASSGEPLKVQPADEDDVIKTAHAAELAGLAFSGGGIRSATFNLGILR